MIEENAPVLNFVRKLVVRPNWTFYRKTGFYVFKDSVIVNLSEYDGLYPGQNAPFLENDCLLIRSVYTTSRERKNGFSREALVDLTIVSQEVDCALMAVVGPFTLPQKTVFDLKVAMRFIALGKLELVQEPESLPLVAKMQRLLLSAGFQNNFRLQSYTAYGDDDFPIEKQFAYLPNGLDSTIRTLLLNSNDPFWAYEDEPSSDGKAA